MREFILQNVNDTVLHRVSGANPKKLRKKR